MENQGNSMKINSDTVLLQSKLTSGNKFPDFLMLIMFKIKQCLEFESLFRTLTNKNVPYFFSNWKEKSFYTSSLQPILSLCLRQHKFLCRDCLYDHIYRKRVICIPTGNIWPPRITKIPLSKNKFLELVFEARPSFI